MFQRLRVNTLKLTDPPPLPRTCGSVKIEYDI
jgi:hypothetical protein